MNRRNIVITVVFISIMVFGAGCGNSGSPEKAKAKKKIYSERTFISPLMVYIKEKKWQKKNKIKKNLIFARRKIALTFKERVEKSLQRASQLSDHKKYNEVIKLLLPLSRSSKISLEKKSEVQFMLSLAFDKVGRKLDSKNAGRDFGRNLKKLKGRLKNQEAKDGFGEIFLIDTLLKRDGEDPETLYDELCKKK